VLPALFSEREADVFERVCSAKPRALLVNAAGPRVDTVLEAAASIEARRRIGAAHLERLRTGLGPDMPLLIVPELFTRATGRRVVTLMAGSIHDELV
jgi:hypothetical protein